jgi:hypothetical protein
MPERFDVFGERARHHDGDIGAGRALVAAQLGEPSVAPVFRSFGLPEDGTAGLPHWTNDALENVATEFALTDGLDAIHRKLGAQGCLHLKLKGFAL